MRRKRHSHLVSIVCLGLLLAACGPSDEGRSASTPDPVLVFVAAGMSAPASEIGAVFEARTGRAVNFSFAASSTLARQIDSGAQPVVFISANKKWMDFVVEKGHAQKESVRDLATTSLVVVAPEDSEMEVEFVPEFPFADTFEGRLSIGDPEHVPAGMYARQALESLGWWDALQDRLAPAPDVKSAVRAVALGQTQAGIVYAAVVVGEPRVRLVGGVPGGLHKPIAFLVTPLGESPSPEAEAFVDFLYHDASVAIFAKNGFVVERP